MKPTHWYVTLSYDILTWLFNLQISKHTPNQEKHISHQTNTTLLSLWPPFMRLKKIKYEKVLPTLQQSLAAASLYRESKSML